MKLLLIFIAGLLLAWPASAEQSQWLVRAGAHNILPQSDNGDVVEVDNDTMVTFNVTYFATENWAVELLAALPFKHDIELIGGGKVADTKHLPPTLSVQYHFLPDRSIRPYVGAGVNYTIFFEEGTTGPLAGSRLSLDNSVGLALQMGVDFDINDRWFTNLDVRYIDIDTKAKLNGSSIGTVDIDPWLVGLNLGVRL